RTCIFVITRNAISLGGIATESCRWVASPNPVALVTRDTLNYRTYARTRDARVFGGALETVVTGGRVRRRRIGACTGLGIAESGHVALIERLTLNRRTCADPG